MRDAAHDIRRLRPRPHPCVLAAVASTAATTSPPPAQPTSTATARPTCHAVGPRSPSGPGRARPPKASRTRPSPTRRHRRQRAPHHDGSGSSRARASSQPASTPAAIGPATPASRQRNRAAAGQRRQQRQRGHRPEMDAAEGDRRLRPDRETRAGRERAPPCHHVGHVGHRHDGHQHRAGHPAVQRTHERRRALGVCREPDQHQHRTRSDHDGDRREARSQHQPDVDRQPLDQRRPLLGLTQCTETATADRQHERPGQRLERHRPDLTPLRRLGEQRRHHGVGHRHGERGRQAVEHVTRTRQPGRLPTASDQQRRRARRSGRAGRSPTDPPTIASPVWWASNQAWTAVASAGRTASSWCAAVTQAASVRQTRQASPRSAVHKRNRDADERPRVRAMGAASAESAAPARPARPAGSRDRVGHAPHAGSDGRSGLAPAQSRGVGSEANLDHLVRLRMMCSRQPGRGSRDAARVSCAIGFSGVRSARRSGLAGGAGAGQRQAPRPSGHAVSAPRADRNPLPVLRRHHGRGRRWPRPTCWRRCGPTRSWSSGPSSSSSCLPLHRARPGSACRTPPVLTRRTIARSLMLVVLFSEMWQLIRFGIV